MALSKVQTGLLADNVVEQSFQNQIGGRRNLIINGAMQVTQRGTSETGVGASSGYFTADRFGFFRIGTTSAEWTNSVSTDTPSGQGFSSSWKWDCTTVDNSPNADARHQIQQVFEGQDLQHLAWGSSAAKDVTLSFWVKATKTGTNYIFLYHHDGVSHIAYDYTIDATDTWEKKTITINKNTADSIANDNTAGFNLVWLLYVGSDYTDGTYQEGVWRDWSASDYNQFVNQTNHADSTDNNFYITGVQLEVGTVATPFEHRSYGEELALCQRYYVRATSNNGQFDLAFVGYNNTSSQTQLVWQLPVTMRTGTTSIEYSDDATGGVLDNFEIRSGGNQDIANLAFIGSGDYTLYFSANTPGTPLSGSGAGVLRSTNSSAFLAVDVEL